MQLWRDEYERGIWFSDEFQEDAVVHIAESGQAISKVAERLGWHEIAAHFEGATSKI